MKRKTVLVAGPKFHGYVEQITAAFRDIECDAYVLEGFESNNYLKALANRVPLRSEWVELLNFNIEFYRKRLKRVFSNLKPDLLLIIRPDYFSAQFLHDLRLIRRCCKIAAWFTDPFNRFPMTAEGLNELDAAFVYDRGDLPHVSALGVNAFSLPMGFDSRVYIAKNDVQEPDIKLAFVGSIPPSSQRIEELEFLTDQLNCSKKEAYFYVGKIGYLSRLRKKLSPEKSKLFSDGIIRYKTLASSESAELYRSSKICINIHQKGTISGFNPRFFEIAGAGGLQLAKYIQDMEYYFEPGKEVVFYRTNEELRDYSRFYIRNEKLRRQICQAAAIRAHAEHTFNHRVKIILETLF